MLEGVKAVAMWHLDVDVKAMPARIVNVLDDDAMVSYRDCDWWWAWDLEGSGVGAVDLLLLC